LEYYMIKCDMACEHPFFSVKISLVSHEKIFSGNLR
jgi:hypothetical protein